MASLSQAKTLGGVGSILVLLGAIPNIGFVLAIVGFILILIAVKNVSESVNEPAIFNDMIIGAALTIVLVGFLILLIAEILQIVAFFSIPEQLPSSMPAQQTWGPPAPPAPMPPSPGPTQ